MTLFAALRSKTDKRGKRTHEVVPLVARVIGPLLLMLFIVLRHRAIFFCRALCEKGYSWNCAPIITVNSQMILETICQICGAAIFDFVLTTPCM
jgi:hypothetical protein